MPRRPHKYHFIYKTTFIADGRFYLGLHSTSNLNDGYIGSGKYLRRMMRKYGKASFQFEILEWCLDRESLKVREREIVNDEMLENPLCMNLVKGGEGGAICGRKLTPEQCKAISERQSGVPKSEAHRKSIAIGCTGLIQTEETKKVRAEKIREFWKNDPLAEISKQKKSEALKESWKTRDRKPLSMSPGAIALREKRKTQTT